MENPQDPVAVRFAVLVAPQQFSNFTSASSNALGECEACGCNGASVYVVLEAALCIGRRAVKNRTPKLKSSVTGRPLLFRWAELAGLGCVLTWSSYKGAAVHICCRCRDAAKLLCPRFSHNTLRGAIRSRPTVDQTFSDLSDVRAGVQGPSACIHNYTLLRSAA